MISLALHEFHEGLNGRFTEIKGRELVADYGGVLAEHRALQEAAGVLDLSGRSRVCLIGADRQKFLNGQVTNNVKDLAAGTGCYAAVISAKGKMQSDLYIYNMAEELLLDFEPGFSQAVRERLEKYVIADDVQILDVADDYGLLSVQGPKAAEVVRKLGLDWTLPEAWLNFTTLTDPNLGQLYLMNQPRTGSAGFDLFVPTGSLGAVADKLIAAAKELGGRACGWSALEIRRIEAGMPRYGADMDETNLPPEAGLDVKAMSYTKGCYIGQEVMARLRTYGQVAKALRGLKVVGAEATLPTKGDKLFKDGKEVGVITSATTSPLLGCDIALGYLRRESNGVGTKLTLRTAGGERTAEIVELPFVRQG